MVLNMIVSSEITTRIAQFKTVKIVHVGFNLVTSVCQKAKKRVRMHFTKRNGDGYLYDIVKATLTHMYMELVISKLTTKPKKCRPQHYSKPA